MSSFSISLLCLNITLLPIPAEDKKVKTLTSALFLILKCNLIQVIHPQILEYYRLARMLEA